MWILAGLFSLGGIVALLPAQESARRTASRFREVNPSPPGSAPQPMAPPSLSPPAATDGGSLPGPSGHSTSVLRSPFAGSQSAAGGLSEGPPAAGEVPADASASEPQHLPEATLAAPTDEQGLHSVLKRNRPPVLYESPAPPPTALGSPRLQPPATFAPPAETTITSEPQVRSRSIPALPQTSAAPQPSAMPPAALTPGVRTSRDVAAAGKNATIKVEVAGPAGVVAGKPATYTVTATNDSDSPAEEVQLRVLLPAFVAVEGSQPTSGEAALQGDAQGSRLVWSLPRLAGRSREQLKLQLVTREADAFDLGVEWTARPAFVRAGVTVKQPQLQLSLSGPADMTYGEEKPFLLTVSNPGSGDAEHVILTVAAAGAPAQQFDAGVIPAGHKKEVPLAVVASQPGTVEIVIAGTADGDLNARTASKVTVRKADVRVAIEGPPLKFAGSEAAYTVSVANSGTAAADNVNLSLALPAGAKYLGGIEGAAGSGSSVKWKIGSLPPGGERTYDVRVQLQAAGQNRLLVEAQAASSDASSSEAATEVEAVADLKLAVNDPTGPVSVGDEAVYELTVMNRGTQAARQVKIVMQFADGIEPVAFEGCDARLVPGQVLCQPLPQLGAGEQVTLRIKAKAQEAGSRPFRVEVTSTDGDTRLVSEGTTRFFVDSNRGSAATTASRQSLLPPPPMPTVVR